MSDYISRDAAIRAILTIKDYGNVVEVRHGEWKEVRYDEADGYYILYRCSHCGCERPKRDNYCKDCGAVMDGSQKPPKEEE